MSKRVLFVDDSEGRFTRMTEAGILPPDTVWAKDGHEALKLVYQEWDVIFLDHDLDTEEFVPYRREITGRTVAEELSYTEWNKDLLVVIIHSMNPSGAIRISNVLNAAGIQSIIAPVHQLVGK